MKKAVREFNEVIDGVNDRERQDISRAMLLLITAVAVGPNPARLARETGYAIEFVEAVASRMRKAGLWLDELVDNREWSAGKEEVIGPALFAHALVALGEATREETSTGAVYRDAETGTVVGMWNEPTRIQ
jgi:hypothetical protein